MGVTYLYGAAVQGIQDYIFQTNKLKEIVGASKIVEWICTEAFNEYGADPACSVVRAAGNIKYLFSDESACRKAVLEFPKKVMEKAPGITISQAVVKIENDSQEAREAAINEIEARLRIQRNKQVRKLTLGYQGVNRIHTTGLPVVEKEGQHSDMATLMKLEAAEEAKDILSRNSFGEDNLTDGLKTTEEIEKFTGSNDWIAIIHIDGNGLGQIVSRIGGDFKKFHTFSQKLDEATKIAAQKAFKDIKGLINDKIIPMRPIVLSGDDHTIICRGNLAFPYVQSFMAAFEKSTEELLTPVGFGKLTSCAGIAYIKSSFPFYYGYELAESLCSKAKKDAKMPERLDKDGLAPSCMMFHKVQDSFVENYESIAARELTPQKNLSFMFGPYYLNETSERWSMGDLYSNAITSLTEENNAVKTHLRRWLSEVHQSEEKAQQLMERLTARKRNLASSIREYTSKDERNSVPVYDMLALNTIHNQDTSGNENN